MDNVRVKYPRTPHLPWSEGSTDDDSRLASVAHFEGQEIVVTEKMDGENTTIYRDYVHARSLENRNHPSRDWVKALQARIGWQLPASWRLCGENVYATHSIAYGDLRSYFYLFSVWDEHGAFAWDDTVRVADGLELQLPQVLFRGQWAEATLRGLPVSGIEGYVVRLTRGFTRSDFGRSVAKYVRADHVQTDDHWLDSEMKVNKLLPGSRLPTARGGAFRERDAQNLGLP